MAITVGPSQPFAAVLDGAPSSMVGILGVRIDDSAGAVVVARTTAGIVEHGPGTGVYSAQLVAPAPAGTYFVVWDNGASTFAVEQLDVAAGADDLGVHDYVTLADMKESVSLTGQTYADEDIQLAITAASRAIDHRTGRQFWTTLGTSPRTFSPVVGEWLFTGDFCELDTVTWDATARVLDTDFYLAPTGGPPWDVLRSNGLTFPVGAQTVMVSARWGWEAVPPEITQATKIIASRLFRRPREAAFGVAALGFDSGAVYVARTDPDVDMLLAPYIRHFGSDL